MSRGTSVCLFCAIKMFVPGLWSQYKRNTLNGEQTALCVGNKTFLHVTAIAAVEGICAITSRQPQKALIAKKFEQTGMLQRSSHWSKLVRGKCVLCEILIQVSQKTRSSECKRYIPTAYSFPSKYRCKKKWCDKF